MNPSSSIPPSCAKADWQTWHTSLAPLDSPSSLTSFPDPPAYACHRDDCLKGSHLQACHHDLERMLRGSGEYSRAFLRKLTHHFHPDKFSACPVEVREAMAVKAKEMFQMLGRLLDEVVDEFDGSCRRWG